MNELYEHLKRKLEIIIKELYYDKNGIVLNDFED